MKILLLTKSTPWCHLVQDVLRKSSHDVTIVEWIGEDKFRGFRGEQLRGMRWDLIVSYLCPWIVPVETLAQADRAINFHPAPVSHPGFAPYSWALYYNDTIYGITVHEMAPKVDTGDVIYQAAVPLYPGDSVWRLQQRTMGYLFAAFVKFIQTPVPWSPLPRKGSLWLRPPRTRADFENLRQLRDDMPSWEIERRIRACRYPGQPGAYFPGEPS